MQISDSHIGFHQPANPNAIGTLQEGTNVYDMNGGKIGEIDTSSSTRYQAA